MRHDIIEYLQAPAQPTAPERLRATVACRWPRFHVDAAEFRPTLIASRIYHDARVIEAQSRRGARSDDAEPMPRACIAAVPRSRILMQSTLAVASPARRTGQARRANAAHSRRFTLFIGPHAVCSDITLRMPSRCKKINI